MRAIERTPHPGRGDGSQQSPAVGACRCWGETMGLRGTRRLSGIRRGSGIVLMVSTALSRAIESYFD